MLTIFGLKNWYCEQYGVNHFLENLVSQKS
jgi:hypothetical protein